MERIFGILPDGRAVRQFTLTDGVLTCEILSYGGILRSLRVPDRSGESRDVVLGFDTLESYLTQDKYLGAIIGRYANRLGGASFTLSDETYQLAANDGRNHLHGGSVGFDRQLWTVDSAEDDRLVLSLISPDGQEGYPGTLHVRVCYAVKGGALSVTYRAETDRDTLCSLTNHSYFNLDGHGAGSILGHKVQIRADCFTPINAEAIPNGQILPLAQTPMDLRKMTVLGSVIDAPYEQLQLARGFDHNYIPNGSGLREIAAAEGGESGIRLHVSSTMPGVQFYTGNYLRGCPAGKGGAVYDNRSGFCFETQFFPDAPHHSAFPSAVLRQGAPYRHTTVFSFER